VIHRCRLLEQSIFWWHSAQAALPEYWLRGGSPFVGHQPGSSSLSAVVRLVPFACGPCARATQNAIPANANMMLGVQLLKLESPFSNFNSLDSTVATSCTTI
jgi:hypothetical protein